MGKSGKQLFSSEDGKNKLKSYIPNKMIVLGGNHHNTLGIIRSLGESGCKAFLIVIGSDKSFVSKSKYIKKHWYTKNDFQVIDILIHEFSKEKVKPIIIPADDYSESLIDRNISRLKNKYILPGIREKDCAVLKKMNKLAMNEFAERYGLAIPKSYAVNLKNGQDFREEINKMDFQYPCIIKPMQSIDGLKSDIDIAENRLLLEKKLRLLKAKQCTEVIVQQFINKDGEVGIEGIVTLKSEEVIIPGIIEKIRQSTLAIGSTTYAKLIKHNSLVQIEKIKSLMKGLGYKGIFDMELIYTKDKVYFIELNFRNGAYGYAFTKAGINLPALWCLEAIGQDISNEPREIRKEITLMSEIADFRNVLERKIGLLKWIFQFLNTEAHLIVNKHDIKPFIYKFLYSINSIWTNRKK